ncbi:MAG TPA: HNH endonuclease signature motif containing protein [Solirubrobacteraceae bacterium]|nr:HNH endonuclease signature motif containing protein [Solirubrobacteraceae bacterium]
MSLRERIEERDGPRCVWCDREVWPRDRTLDHLVPSSRRGRAHESNLVLACRPCNRARRSRPATAWGIERERAGWTVRWETVVRVLGELETAGGREERDAARRQLRRLGNRQGTA